MGVARPKGKGNVFIECHYQFLTCILLLEFNNITIVSCCLVNVKHHLGMYGEIQNFYYSTAPYLQLFTANKMILVSVIRSYSSFIMDRINKYFPKIYITIISRPGG